MRDPTSPEQKAIFSRGNNVGLLAQRLFPGGVDATPPKRSDNIAAVEKTQQLIKDGVEIIYEAAFQHGQVLAILDILVKKPARTTDGVLSGGDNQWYAYEVKSSTKISQTYLLDASLQYWVITNSGIPLEDISLVTINNQYVKQGDLKLNELFNFTSVKKEALNNQVLVEEKINSSMLVVANPQMPVIGIGEHCFSPYNCDFMGTCWKNVPKNSVFEITGIQKAEQFNLYNQGYKTIAEIPEVNALDKNANIHIQAFKKGEAKVDIASIKTFLDKVTYPVFFMDFESFMPAVPIYNNTKPYQHIPFQYSLHYKKDKEAPVEHFYFLAEQGADPRKKFLESLLKHTENNGTILVYDALMERNILNSLKKDFPEYTAQIDERLKRFVDLMLPFQNRNYYHPAMKNSYSIKNILHALVPDLSYTNLKISSGSIAMVAFEHLQTETDLFKIIETREDLLEYCKLDTLSMVRIFEILEKQV
ncbi:MAG: DUF2779 domain-containing protein [Bacteroidota bacterium]